VKTALGWEEVQLLDWQGIRTLLTLGWVAAGFLFDLGVSFEWAQVQLLARLGGWEPHKDRVPGKITLQRGLSRLLEMLFTQAILSDYATEHQGLPPGLPPSYTAGNLRGIYEWMSGQNEHLVSHTRPCLLD
jgi:hypothetical protein